MFDYNFSQGFSIVKYFQHHNLTEILSDPAWESLPNSYKEEFIGKFYNDWYDIIVIQCPMSKHGL